ncbi:MAG: hypothetical protein HY265_08355 [Deltaproteobacteria bacterium]|nr:hypothetical protein [Deltaproteobacteria bacterium]
MRIEIISTINGTRGIFACKMAGVVAAAFLIIATGTVASAAVDGMGNFSFGVRAGGFLIPNAKNFYVAYNNTNNNGITYYEVSESDETSGGGFPFVRLGFTEKLGLEVEYGKEDGPKVYKTINNISTTGVYREEIGKMSISTLSGSVVYMFRSEGFTPYIKAGLLRGEVELSSLPGSFDTGLGWLAGGGIEVAGRRFSLSLDVFYRNLTNKYNKATDRTVVAGEFVPSKIDLSGFGITGGVIFKF